MLKVHWNRFYAPALCFAVPSQALEKNEKLDTNLTRPNNEKHVKLDFSKGMARLFVL